MPVMIFELQITWMVEGSCIFAVLGSDKKQQQQDKPMLVHELHTAGGAMLWFTHTGSCQPNWYLILSIERKN